MIAAVIFDLDGVLVNTEPLKAIAHAGTVDALGGRGHPEWYRELMGRAHDIVVTEFMRLGGVAAPIEAYDRRYRERYAALMHERVRLTEGALDLHESIAATGLRSALVTSSARWMADAIIARLGMADWFDVVITADDVEHEKPDPEPYLKALAGLGIKAGDAVVIEDSASGIRAATAAGIRVVGLRHGLNASHDMHAAVTVFDGGLPTLAALQSAVTTE